jgi:uncharacterized membrane protein
MERYAVAIEALERITEFLVAASDVVTSCADLLKSPQRIGDEKDSLRGTLWFTTADLNGILAQWRVCVADAWTAWNDLPGPEQAKVEPPRFALILRDSDFFRHR